MNKALTEHALRRQDDSHGHEASERPEMRLGADYEFWSGSDEMVVSPPTRAEDEEDHTMRHHRQLRDNRGLTLMEIIVATAVLTIGLSGLAAAMLGAVASSEYSRAETVAIQDAKDVLERLANIPAVGAVGTNGTLLDEAADINAGNWNLTPWGAGAQPLNLPNENLTVYVNQYALGAGGAPINVNALPPVNNVAVIPTAGRAPLEVIVVVNWTQGARPMGVVMRTVINVPA